MASQGQEKASTPPPNDLNRLAQAWSALQALVNLSAPQAVVQLRGLTGRLHR